MIKKQFLLTIFLCISFCDSTKAKIKTHSSKPKLDLNKEQFLKRIVNHYGPYQKLSAYFTIKGKIKNQELYYNGKQIISFSKEKKLKHLLIELREPFLKALMFSLRLKGDYVYVHDPTKQKPEKIALKDYRWVEIFGRIFPFEFFLPVLMGFPPSDIFAPGAKINFNKQRIKNSNRFYDLVVDFDDGKIKEFFFKSKTQKEIIIIEFKGNILKGKKRHFPKMLKISQTETKGIIKIIFNKVKIKEYR